MFPQKLHDAGLAESVSFGLKTFYKGDFQRLKELVEFKEKEEEDVDEDEEQVRVSLKLQS